MVLLKTGTLLLHEKPFAYVLEHPHLFSHCSTCLREESLKTCNKCKMFRYCSKNCQVEDWLDHKNECKNLQKYKVYDNDVLLAGRIIYKIKNNNKDSSQYILMCNQHMKLSNCNFQNPISYHNKDHINLGFMSFVFHLRQYIPKNLFAEFENQLEDMYDKIGFYRTSICDDEGLTIGIGIYLHAGKVETKCLPNAVFVNNGPNTLVSLTRDVEVGEGAKLEDTIFFSPKNHLQSYWSRNKERKKMGLPPCNCELCLKHDTLNEYDWSFMPREYSYGPTKDIAQLEKVQRAKCLEFVREIDAKYKREVRNINKAHLIPNKFPSSTNVIYNNILMDHTLLEPDDTSREGLVAVCHRLQAAFGGNVNEYYSENSLTYLTFQYMMFKLAPLMNNSALAIKARIKIESVLKAMFPAEFMAEVDRFGHYKSYVKKLYNLIGEYKLV